MRSNINNFHSARPDTKDVAVGGSKRDDTELFTEGDITGEDAPIPLSENAINTQLEGNATQAITAPSGLGLAITDEMVQAVETMAQLHLRLRLAALRITGPGDWLDLEGVPFLSSSGCFRLARLFKIRQKDLKMTFTDYEGAKVVTITAQASSDVLDPDGWIEVVGTCSTDDKFLTKGGIRKADLGSVIKKAHTNWLALAVRQLLGLSGLSWDDLAKFGIDRSRVKRVELPTKKWRPPSESLDASHVADARSDGAANDIAWVKVDFNKREKFKAAVSALGFKAVWDGEKKLWGVPKTALKFQDVVDCLEEKSKPNAVE